MKTNFFVFLVLFSPIIVISMIIALLQLINKITSERNIDTLKNYYNIGDIESVIRLAKIIISRDSNNGEAHFYIGEAYFSQNKLSSAISEFKTALKLANYTSSFTEINLKSRLIDIYEITDNITEALDICMSLSQKYPENYNFFLKQGQLFEKMNAKDSALTSYVKALELEPTNSDALIRAGILAYNNRNYVDAEIYLTKYEDINKLNETESKKSGELYYYLGLLCKLNSEKERAFEYFDMASSKNNIEIMRKSFAERGNIWVSLGEFKLAADEFEKIIGKNSNIDNSSEFILNVRYTLGNCYELLRDINKATEQWNIIRSIDNQFKDVDLKLQEYEELVKNDYLKEFFTTNEEQFVKMSKDILFKMGFYPNEYNIGSNGHYIEFYVLETSEKNRRDIKKSKKLIYIYRVSSPIEETTVRKVYETMHENNILSATIITTSTYSQQAYNFAKERPIELVDKNVLYNMMVSKV